MRVLVYEVKSGHSKYKEGHIRYAPTESTKSLESLKLGLEHRNPDLRGGFIAEIDSSELPADKEFRNQWRKNGTGVKVDPVLETEERWVRIRKKRNKLLFESDGPRKVAEDRSDNGKSWQEYQNSLRDITAQPDPKDITWPEKPA